MIAAIWLVFLVDDLVELFIQKDGEALAVVVWGRDVAGVVVGYLADVIRDVGHMGMIDKTVKRCTL